MHSFKHENYAGEYNERNQKHGKGTLSCPEYIYKGQWFENKRQGKGVCQYSSSGKVYDGQWKDDLYHGHGFLIGEDLKSYEGNFIQGKKNGKGIIKLHDGTTYYDGHFKDDLFDGIGILTITKLNYRYEGEFFKGKKSGEGVESFTNGSQYNGTFVNGFKHGKGVFTTNSGYSYNGEWQFGVKQGYAVEFNNPNQDADLREEYKEGFLFEGEFWNGKRNGIGKLMNKIGDYYYGRFVNHMKEGVGFEFKAEEKKYTLGIYEEGKVKELFDVDFGERFPAYLNGYHDSLQEIYKKKMKFVDKFFRDKKVDSYYFFKEDVLGKFGDVRVQEPRFLPIDEMSIKVDFSHIIVEEINEKFGRTPSNKSMVKNPINNSFNTIYNNPKIMTGKIFNNQLISFLTDLIRKKEHLKYVINFYSNPQYKFYSFWMFFTKWQLLQKYPIAVNDIVPISIDGLNLFCQIEDSKNVILTMLEKAWTKYVMVNQIEKSLQGRYLDKILLGFLGAPCKKIPLNVIEEKNDLEYLMKIVNSRIPAKGDFKDYMEKVKKMREIGAEDEDDFNVQYMNEAVEDAKLVEKEREKKLEQLMSSYSPYVYAYPRRDLQFKGISGVRYDDAFIVKEFIQTIPDGPVAVILEGVNQSVNYIATIEDSYIKSLKENPKFAYYFRDFSDGNLHFALSFFDFLQIFDVIYYSNYTINKNFEAYMNDTVTISVIQDHILKSGIKITEDSKEEDFNLPIRLILGRKSLKKERMRMFPNQFKAEERNKMRFVSAIKANQAKKQATLADKITKKNKKKGFRQGDKRRKNVIGGEFKRENSKDEKSPEGKIQLPPNLAFNSGNLQQRKKRGVVFSNDVANPLENPIIKVKESSDTDELEEEEVEEMLKKDQQTKTFELDANDVLFKKSTPFDSSMPGIRLSRSDFKYIAGKGQSKATTIDLEDINIEQGKQILLVQLENELSVLSKIKKLRFHIIIQNSLGTMDMTHILKPANFMEKVYTDAAIRLGEQSALIGQTSQHKDLFTFQYFSQDEAVYSQVFVNKNIDKIWNQKLNFNLKNMQILGVKDHRKPITLRIKPKKQRVLIIQQIGCKDFNLIGGEGACFTEDVRKFGGKD